MFTETDKAFLGQIAPVLAIGAHRALLCGQAEEPEYADSPCLLVLDDKWDIESATGCGPVDDRSPRGQLGAW